MKTVKVKEQDRLYDLFHTMPAGDLKLWYDSYNGSFPICVAPMVRCIAVLRGFDVSEWKDFYR